MNLRLRQEKLLPLHFQKDSAKAIGMGASMGYSEFDREFYRPDEKPDKTPYKDAFQLDRENLVCTTAFRRLQGKTQVFRPGLHLSRTRLTHSIEVAMVGRAITEVLNKYSRKVLGEFTISSDLVEFACLAHDLGNPPVGHVGERLLNKLMRPYGGFEGNAQTLRILTQLIHWPGRMRPTRAALDSVIKYTLIFDPKSAKGKFLYEEQVEDLDWIRDGGTKEGQSIECQIMDLADDIVNACADFIDGVRAGLVTMDRLCEWERVKYPAIRDNAETSGESLIKWLKEVVEDRNKHAGFINRFINTNLVFTAYGANVSQVSLEKGTPQTDTRRFDFNLVRLSEEGVSYLADRIEILKSLRDFTMLKHFSVCEKERLSCLHLAFIFKGLEWLYVTSPDDDMAEKARAAVTEDFHRECMEVDKEQRRRLICDYVSGMTDPFLQYTFERLEEPQLGLMGVIEMDDLKEFFPK